MEWEAVGSAHHPFSWEISNSIDKRSIEASCMYAIDLPFCSRKTSGAHFAIDPSADLFT